MLNKQESAWAVYSALFLFFTLILTIRCRHNLYLFPFVLFGLLISIGSICLITNNDGWINTTDFTRFSNIYSSVDRYWISKSLTLSVLPAISFLIFLGIMESQLFFIRHISVAIQTRDRWGSLYLRNPEKKRLSSSQEDQHSKKYSRAYWLSILSLVLYAILAMISVILLMSKGMDKMGIAVCITFLFIVVCFNTAVIVSFTHSTFTKHVRLIRKNKGDVFFLRITPLLLGISMGGMTLLSWMYVSQASIPLTLWIILETFFVYLPFACVLFVCVYSGKFKKMGRQYRVEEDQKSYNRTVTNDIQQVTKKISEEESAKIAYPPPPAYQPTLNSAKF